MRTEIRRHVTQETIDRYGRINGDNDIIHYDAEYAARRGFRGTLAHGLMVMAYAAELGAEQHGRSWFTDGELEVVWTAPVCPGDEVTVRTEGESVHGEVDGGSVLAGALRLRQGDGTS